MIDKESLDASSGGWGPTPDNSTLLWLWFLAGGAVVVALIVGMMRGRG